MISNQVGKESNFIIFFEIFFSIQLSYLSWQCIYLAHSENLEHPSLSRFLVSMFGDGRGQFTFSDQLLYTKYYLYEDHGILLVK